MILAVMASIALIVAAPTQAFAAPAPDCSTLPSRVQALQSQANTLKGQIDAHNSRGGSVDTTNAGAVGAYNAEAQQLTGQRDALQAQANGLQSELSACGSKETAPAIPNTDGSAPAPPAPAKPAKPEAPAKPAPAKPAPPKSDATPAPAPAKPAAPKSDAKPAPQNSAPAQPAAPKPAAPAQPASPKPSQPAAPAPEQSAQPKPTGVEQRNAPMQSKINDPEYRAKYYQQQGSNGVIKRKPGSGVDANGELVPAIRENPKQPGSFVESQSSPTVRATYDGPAQQRAPTSAESSQMRENVVARNQAVRDVQRLKAESAAQQTTGGKVDPRTESELKDAYVRQTAQGEGLGEAAGRQAIARDYPASKYDVRELTSPRGRSGPGDPDQVFVVRAKTGGSERMVVQEVKGPSAKSGSRIGLDGQRYEQGTRGYLDSLIDEMARNGDPRALSMRSALNRGALSYRLVKARVSGDEWAGYSVRNFDIG
ncbi:hypothetical protein GOSPT_006_00160 [Gordonia sputi NBRC 100414]|uniref:Uncharacterized protein n=3 Tax=Gordonia TaxID=2053 RepID=H5TV18_9ACTN|nr:hypothetical protein GOSPT_006_00160 [Gordonia sputi NBRC 100414]